MLKYKHFQNPTKIDFSQNFRIFHLMAPNWASFKLFIQNFLQPPPFRIWNYNMKSGTGRKKRAKRLTGFWTEAKNLTRFSKKIRLRFDKFCPGLVEQYAFRQSFQEPSLQTIYNAAWLWIDNSGYGMENANEGWMTDKGWKPENADLTIDNRWFRARVGEKIKRKGDREKTRERERESERGKERERERETNRQRQTDRPVCAR